MLNEFVRSLRSTVAKAIYKLAAKINAFGLKVDDIDIDLYEEEVIYF